MPRLSRLVLTVLLAVVLASTAALAQSPSGSALRPLRAAELASPNLFSRLWSLLASWNKNGCQVDPSGRCLTQGSTVETGDNGCELDPSGRCRVQPKNGCEFDPSGRCRVQTKNGCELDPDGRCIR
jgi:hypothetical protein